MPATMMMLWAVSIIPFGAYAITQGFAIPLQLQPQAFGVLALTAWGQTYYYDSYVREGGELVESYANFDVVKCLE